MDPRARHSFVRMPAPRPKRARAAGAGGIDAAARATNAEVGSRARPEPAFEWLFSSLASSLVPSSSSRRARAPFPPVPPPRRSDPPRGCALSSLARGCVRRDDDDNENALDASVTTPSQLPRRSASRQHVVVGDALTHLPNAVVLAPLPAAASDDDDEDAEVSAMTTPEKVSAAVTRYVDDVRDALVRGGDVGEDAGEDAAGAQGAFDTLVPIRRRWRGERRSLRTFPGASLRPPLAFNPRPRRLSTPTDAFELHPERFVWNASERARRRRTSKRASEHGASRLRGLSACVVREASYTAGYSDCAHRDGRSRGATLRRGVGALTRRPGFDPTARRSRPS